MPYVYQPRSGNRRRTVFKVAKAEMPALRRGGATQFGWKSKKRLTTLVKKVVRGQAETKYVADQFDKNSNAALANVFQLTALGVGALRFVPMIPRCVQGVDDNNRIGDVISPSGKVKTTLHFAINDDVVTSHQILVTVYYGVTKDRKSWDNINPLSTAQFLDNGDGTNSSPNISRITAMSPVQRDLVSFKKIQFVLSKATGSTGGDAGGGNAAANAGKSFRTITLTHSPPKKLKYSVQNDVYPVNYAPGFFIQLCYADGAVPESEARINGLVNISCRQHMWFKDM